MDKTSFHLIAGIAFLIWGSIYLVTGKAFDRAGRTLNRKDPFYWIIVISLLVVGVGNIIWSF